MSKIERAQTLVDEAKRRGVSLEVAGNWVTSTPPLPVEMLMEIQEVADEVAAIVGRGDEGA